MEYYDDGKIGFYSWVRILIELGTGQYSDAATQEEANAGSKEEDSSESAQNSQDEHSRDGSDVVEVTPGEAHIWHKMVQGAHEEARFTTPTGILTEWRRPRDNLEPEIRNLVTMFTIIDTGGDGDVDVGDFEAAGALVGLCEAGTHTEEFEAAIFEVTDLSFVPFLSQCTACVDSASFIRLPGMGRPVWQTLWSWSAAQQYTTSFGASCPAYATTSTHLVFSIPTTRARLAPMNSARESQSCLDGGLRATRARKWSRVWMQTGQESSNSTNS